MFRCLITAAILGLGLQEALLAAWPPAVETAAFASPADGSEQKTLFYAPPGDEPVPLLVAFHTWSGDYRQNESPYARWCIARGWVLVHPDLRGPANHAEAAGSDLAFAALPLDINTGIHDGHVGSVPVSHAIRAFNAVAAPTDRLPTALIAQRAVPADWRTATADPLYAARPVLLRRTSGPTRLTVFDGGHEILHEAALTWLEAQRRGAPPQWNPAPHEPRVLPTSAAESGR